MPSEKVIAGTGDSITSMAEQRGFFWETIWNHGDNSALKQKRKDPNIIQAGDEVSFPEKTEKLESGATEARHKFKRKGVPAMLKLRLTRLGKPRKDEDYVLTVDGKLFTGKTDGDGVIEVEIPPDASSGILKLPKTNEEYPVNIGRLDPFDTPSGVKQRLNNMGFDAGPVNEDLKDPKAVAAIKTFQSKNGLTPSGEADEATKKKIDEVHV